MVSLRNGGFVAPERRTLSDWLTTWLQESRATKRTNTQRAYEAAIAHLAAALGHVRLQSLRSGDMARYYADKRADGLAENTLAIHQSMLSAALKSAVRQGLVAKNVAADVDAKPHASRASGQLKSWTADECRAFMRTAHDAGTQWVAFFGLALDSGARRAELLGLRWSDGDLDASRVVIKQQLLIPGPPPQFRPPKAGGARPIDVNDGTIRLLREHKRAQSETKVRNRTSYDDHDLVFALDWRMGSRHRLGNAMNFHMALPRR
jgi:integrase